MPYVRVCLKCNMIGAGAFEQWGIAFLPGHRAAIEGISVGLERCCRSNHWANRGPLYRLLAERYTEHFGLAADRAITPCANGGIALEAIARLFALRAGRKLRWVGSSFSFANLGRGYFSDVRK